MADHTSAGFGFDQHVATKPCNDQAGLCSGKRRPGWAGRFAQASKASSFDAQKKSLMEIPFTSCVLKRTVHLL